MLREADVACRVRQPYGLHRLAVEGVEREVGRRVAGMQFLPHDGQLLAQFKCLAGPFFHRFPPLICR